MDRGIPTEETLAAMRDGETPVNYLVGTPKGRLTALERSFLALPWREAAPVVPTFGTTATENQLVTSK